VSEPASRREGAAGEASGADEVFVALADPTRRLLLDALAARGEASATILAAELPVSRQAVVKHLAVLDRAGLVRGARRGREVRYSVRPERLDSTARWLAGLAAEWDARLAAIKRLAEDDGSAS
jgi:DNA-binding transcriptional ArsR family regulator